MRSSHISEIVNEIVTYNLKLKLNKISLKIAFYLWNYHTSLEL